MHGNAREAHRTTRMISLQSPRAFILNECQMDSFMDMVFSEDPEVHRKMCPEGGAQAWVEANERCPRVSSSVATPDVCISHLDLCAVYN